MLGYLPTIVYFCTRQCDDWCKDFDILPVFNRFNIYNHEIPRSASHDLGIFIFPEFYWQSQGERLWAKYLPTRQDYNRKEDRMANRRN